MQEENKLMLYFSLSLFFKEQEWTKNISPFFPVQKPILLFTSCLIFLQAPQSTSVDNEPIIVIFLVC